ncbi:MAG: class I SAM-dependent methyltransferase [Candidatus Eisenbacteria bacterium]
MFGSGEAFRYFQCSECLCLQIEAPPPDLSDYYPDGYYSYRAVGGRSSLAKRLLKSVRDDYAVFRTAFIGRLLNVVYPADARLQSLSRIPLQRDSGILDVGCGRGELLLTLQGMGFTSLLGIDPFNAEEIDYGGGLSIRRETIHELNGKWDLVMFHHSFEHVPDPAETLESASKLLRPGGYCLVRAPVVPSFAWEHYGTNWVQLEAPRHLFLHSADSIRMLAARSHLELVGVVHDSTSFQFWGSEQYLKGIALTDERSHGRNPTGSVFSAGQIHEFERRAKHLNAEGQGDQGAFYLKKTDRQHTTSVCTRRAWLSRRLHRALTRPTHPPGQPLRSRLIRGPPGCPC